MIRIFLYHGQTYIIICLAELIQSIYACEVFTHSASVPTEWQFPKPIYQGNIIGTYINQIYRHRKLEAYHIDTVLLQNVFNLACPYPYVFFITCSVKLHQINIQSYVSNNVYSLSITLFIIPHSAMATHCNTCD